MTVCPNCGYQQDGGEKCAKCSSLFAYYFDSAPQITSAGNIYVPRVTEGTGRTDVPDVVEEPGFFDGLRTFYRRARWVALALAVVVIVLILRKGTPPHVTVDPNAAARAEEKIRESEAESSVGQPHKLQLNGTELNSYLNENLAINGRTEPGTAAVGATPSFAETPSASSVPAASPASAPNLNGPAPTMEEVESSVKDVKVDIVGDLVKAYVIFGFHGQDLSLELDGHLHAENGYLKFDPVSGSIGSMPLPSSMLQSVAEHILDSPENRDKMKLPAGISDIQIVDGQAVVSYK
ncbi:MAG: hypothetical protein WCA98_16605 [Candidatus Acidiferrales bacterium]